MRHLTQRAVEWLRDSPSHRRVKYTSEVGVRACDQKKVEPGFGVLWTTVADVRAIHCGWEQAYTANKGRDYSAYGYEEKKPRPIEMPTCPQCSVMLDALLAVMPEYKKKISNERIAFTHKEQ